MRLPRYTDEELLDIFEKLDDGTISDIDLSDIDDFDDETILFVANETEEEICSKPESLDRQQQIEDEPQPGPSSTSRTQGTEERESEVEDALQPGPALPHKVRKDKRMYSFRKIDLVEADTLWKSSFPLPPCVEQTPYEYFLCFWPKDLFVLLHEQSTIYAHQKDGVILNSSPAEMEQLVGILLLMGIVKMPSWRMYWAAETRYAPVADVMSQNRFDMLRRYLHVVNNDDQIRAGQPGHDKLFKVRPLLNILRSNMHQIPPEERQAIDEQMIPFKGRSSCKQYVKNKPHKWGFKVFMRAGQSGIMYDFEIYTGKGTCEEVGLGLSGDIVMALTSELPDHQNFKVYFDNWFSSLQLAIALKERGIFCVGTIRNDRMVKCSLLPECELKKLGRGSYDFRVEKNENVALVRWFDRKAVNFVSTYAAIEPLGKCKRWSAAEKQSVEIKCPNVVSEYNHFMGGADLADMLLELYRIDIRSVKWYNRIIFWCINVSVVNAWLLYRRHQQQRNTSSEYSLAKFQAQIASALTQAGQGKAKKRRSNEQKETPAKNQFVPRPVDDVRYDGYQHWPTYLSKGRCKFCRNGFTQVMCTKCKLNLCMTPLKNCFMKFHMK